LAASCLFAASLFSAASGLDPAPSIRQFHHTAWTAKDGAPNAILSITQTTDGYLWLGSLNGLFRFDGIRFEQYQPRFGESFPSNEIASLLALPDGGLWIGYVRGGASLLIKDHATNYGEKDGLPAGRLAAFVQDQSSAVWAAVHSGGLFRLEDGQWKRAGGDWNFTARTAQTVFVDRKGTLWMATDDTVLYLPRGAKSFQPTGEHIGVVCQIAEAPDGRLWLAETTGNVRLLRFPDRAVPEVKAGSQAILFDDAGALWATSVGDGIAWIRHPAELRPGVTLQNDKAVEMFTHKEGLTDDVVLSIFQDRERNVWIGTPNGLERFRRSKLTPVVLPAGYQRFAIAAGDGGTIWVGSQNRPITQVQGDKITPYFGGPISCGYRDPQGEIWLGGYGEVYHIVAGKPSVSLSLFPKADRLAMVGAVTRDRGGRLLVGMGDRGIWTLEKDRWQQYENAALPSSAVTAAHTDAQGGVWFGYGRDLVASLNGETVHSYSKSDGLAIGGVKVIGGRNDSVWIAGEFGLAFLKQGHFQMLSAADAVPFRGVSGIVETADGSLWLSESRGVIEIPSAEVRSALRDASYKVRYQLFDFADGLPGAIQQVATPTAVEGTDGRLWFATSGGLVWVDPGHIQKNLLPPPVYVSSVSAHGKEYTDLTSLNFPARTRTIQITYTALSLTVPERVQFRYKLDGMDQDWQDPGARREAIYTNLGPGKHRFQVIAANSDGVWNKTGAILDFSIAPAFYQTEWFVLLCCAMALVLAWFVYVWRMRVMEARLESQFSARLAERTRIAQELHDTLLQGFLSASMQLHLVEEDIPAESPVKPRLTRVLELMAQVIAEGRNALRGLRASDLESDDLDQAFSRLPQEFVSREGTEFRVIAEGEVRPLRRLVRDDVYRIGREAVANAFRHARASTIEVEIEYAQDELRVTVRDDGCGIEPPVVHGGREGHWGLLGMRERAERIGAQLRVWSRDPGGTQVELRIPGKIAFQSNNGSRRVRWSRWF